MNFFLSFFEKLFELFYDPFAIEVIILFIVSFIFFLKKKKKSLLVILVIIGWRCFYGITSKRYLSIFLTLAILYFGIAVNTVVQKPLFSRLLVFFTCLLLLTKTLSYNPYHNWYKTTAKEISEELAQFKDTTIISFLDNKKNRKINFGNNFNIVEYLIFSKNNRIKYMNSCLSLFASALPAEDKNYLVLLEGLPNEDVSTIPGFSLKNSTYINNKRKSKIYIYSFRPIGNREPSGDAQTYLYKETFENKTDESFYKNWHVIKSQTNGITLDISAPISGSKSLRIISPDSLLYFSNYNMYKRIYTNLSLSFISSGPIGGELSLYLGYWTTPTDNITSFQFYSYKYLSNDTVEHIINLPSTVCGKENYFNIFFSVDKGTYYIDNITLSY